MCSGGITVVVVVVAVDVVVDDGGLGVGCQVVDASSEDGLTSPLSASFSLSLPSSA